MPTWTGIGLFAKQCAKIICEKVWLFIVSDPWGFFLNIIIYIFVTWAGLKEGTTTCLAPMCRAPEVVTFRPKFYTLPELGWRMEPPRVLPPCVLCRAPEVVTFRPKFYTLPEMGWRMEPPHVWPPCVGPQRWSRSDQKCGTSAAHLYISLLQFLVNQCLNSFYSTELAQTWFT